MATAEPAANRDSSASLFARRVFFVVVLLAVTLLAWRLARVFLLVFGAIVVATVLRAFASPIERRLHVGPRAAVAVALLLTLLVLGLGGWLMGDLLVEQSENLRRRVPQAASAFRTWLNGFVGGKAVLDLWEGAKDGNLHWASVADAATVTARGLGMFVLMIVLGIYMAFDPELYRRGLVRLVPPRYRRQIAEAVEASGHALSRWLLGQGISMAFVGSTTALGLALLGVPLALTLGVIAGLLAFVPFFGPIVSGLLAILIAFLEGPTTALYVAVLVLIIEQVESVLLMPIVQRWVVALPPVLAITAAVIFGLLFGVTGVIFATPLMVVAMVLVQKLYVDGYLESTLSAVPMR